MCDYSLHSIKSRPAKVGDKLTTRDFGTGTRGFAPSEDVERRGLRSTRNRVVFCSRGYVPIDWYVGLAG